MVRTDLPLPQQAVQACHAAYEAGSLSSDAEDIYLILCQVKDEKKLQLESEKLNGAGIEHALFREPDLGGQATALATLPLPREASRGRFRRWRLWQPPNKRS